MDLPPETLLNYCMLAVAVVGALAYALRVFRMHRKGEYPLGGTFACIALAIALPWIANSGWIADSDMLLPMVFFAMYALFAHAFLVQDNNLYKNPSYRLKIFIMTVFNLAFLLMILPNRSLLSHNYPIVVCCVFLIFFASSYAIYAANNKKIRMDKENFLITIAASSVAAFMFYPIMFTISLSIAFFMTAIGMRL